MMSQAAAEAVFAIAARTAASPRLREILDTHDEGCVIEHGRGPAMLMVSDTDLSSFERDDTLKSYAAHNHMFADVLGGVESKPILFYLSKLNEPGVTLDEIDDELSIIQLGPGYSLADVTAALGYVLMRQGIRLPRPWFMKELAKHEIDPRDPSFEAFWP